MTKWIFISYKKHKPIKAFTKKVLPTFIFCSKSYHLKPIYLSIQPTWNPNFKNHWNWCTSWKPFKSRFSFLSWLSHQIKTSSFLNQKKKHLFRPYYMFAYSPLMSKIGVDGVARKYDQDYKTRNRTCFWDAKLGFVNN